MKISDRQSVNEHDKLGVIKGNTNNGTVIPGDLKCTLFQPLVIKNKGIALPVQQLNPVTLAVDKNKYLTAQGIPVKGMLDNPGKTIKRLAHIRRQRIKII